MTETIPQPRVAEEAAFGDSSAVAPGLLVYAPLRFEANAVRRGLTQSTSHVQRTGMGAARSQKSAAQSKPGPFSAMDVAGWLGEAAADRVGLEPERREHEQARLDGWGIGDGGFLLGDSWLWNGLSHDVIPLRICRARRPETPAGTGGSSGRSHRGSRSR